jgi:hypothetical protein
LAGRLPERWPHPLAGLAVGFAGIAGAFTVNMIIKPLDASLTELTNDAIHMVNPTTSPDLTALSGTQSRPAPSAKHGFSCITEAAISCSRRETAGAKNQLDSLASIGTHSTVLARGHFTKELWWPNRRLGIRWANSVGCPSAGRIQWAAMGR